MTTHRYAVAVRVHNVPGGLKQADLDRAIQAAIDHSTAREALEEALAAALDPAISVAFELEKSG